MFVRHSPSPTGRNECDAALWRDANQVLHGLVVLVVRVRLDLVSCSARSLSEAIEDHDNLVLIGCPETHRHRFPQLLSVWPSDQESKFRIQYIKCGVKGSLYGR